MALDGLQGTFANSPFYAYQFQVSFDFSVTYLDAQVQEVMIGQDAKSGAKVKKPASYP